ncbi:MAG: plasmid mobilization relaxosome protein MobC [Gemmatimonadaceae bacterium]
MSLTADELARVVARAAECGRTPARFIREVSLGAVPKTRRSRDADQMIRQRARIGNNLNQLAREANASGRFDVEERLDATLAALDAAIDRVA